MAQDESGKRDTTLKPGPFELARFVAAQENALGTALAELAAGRKRSHWMWFIFPQLRGLGHSSTAHHYGLASLAEAQAYLAHPLLGERLERATEAARSSGVRDAHTLFGFPDDLKFHACMTLFARASVAETNPYTQALEHWFSGREHPQTLSLLASSSASPRGRQHGGG